MAAYQKERRGAGLLPVLSERQGCVLHALVSFYVGAGIPVASDTVSALLPMRLSPQSVRNTMSSLSALGLVGKTHHSSGRVPTEAGLRVFLSQCLSPREIGPYEKRELKAHIQGEPAGDVGKTATRLLSERTHQLGFFRAPRLSRLLLRRLSLVRVSRERVLAVLVSEGGRAYQRVIEAPGENDQAELDRISSLLSERVAGQTLVRVRARLLREVALLRSRAERLLMRILDVPADGRGALEEEDVVLGAPRVLLDHPEFRDPERLYALLGAVEEKTRLMEILDSLTASGGVQVAIGADMGDPELQHCALVAAACGSESTPLGAVGVIGPSRMDYARVIPMVGYMSQLLTEMEMQSA